MILPINDQFRITSDRYQWIIQKARRRSRGGRKVLEWESQSYYPTFEIALEQLGARMVREGKVEGFSEALAHVRQVCTTLSQALPTHFEVMNTSEEVV